METIDFTINNDEIEKISKRIHELQTILEKNIPLSDEQMEEYKSLFHLKDLLYRANQVDNKDNFIVVNGMRIERSKVNEFKELLRIVNVPGLITLPNYLGDILPGTKYKMPRSKKQEETFEEYEGYLMNYYEKLGYKFENITYHPGTTVPRLRKPYPHEMYYPSENGYIYDEDYLGTHNEYYQELKNYLDEKLILEYQEMFKDSIDNYGVTSPVYGDISKRHKVVIMEPFVLFLKLKSLARPNNQKYTPLIKALKETAKAYIDKHNSLYQNAPLEDLTPSLKVDITIPIELKKALASVPSNSRQRVVDAEYSINKLIGRAKDMLPKKLVEATNENSDKIEAVDGFYLYNMVPKDILIGNALSKRTIHDKRIAYEIASKFRRLMSNDSSLSHYHDMMLKNFLAVNKEVMTNEAKEVINENNMRI